MASSRSAELVRVVDVRIGTAPARFTESSMATPTGAIQRIAVVLRARSARLGGRALAPPAPARATSLDQQLASLSVVRKVRDRITAALSQAAPNAQKDLVARFLLGEATRQAETLAVAFSMRVDGEAAITSLFPPPPAKLPESRR